MNIMNHTVQGHMSTHSYRLPPKLQQPTTVVVYSATSSWWLSLLLDMGIYILSCWFVGWLVGCLSYERMKLVNAPREWLVYQPKWSRGCINRVGGLLAS